MLIDQNTFQFNDPQGFLVLDGVNGAGKTTLLKNISRYVTTQGFEVLESKEPGATPIGDKIRKLLLETDVNTMGSLAEMFLFSADRAEHVSRLIKPALERSTLVLSDRYYYSTAAFQGYGRNLNVDIVRQINSVAIQNVYPDLVILLDLDPIEGLKRNLNRNDTTIERDSFEEEELDFHYRLREGFLDIAKNYQEAFVVLDASKQKEQLFSEIVPILDSWMHALKANRPCQR